MNEQIVLLEAQLNSIVQGKTDRVRFAVTALLAGGHLLIEDLPGLGKTTLARAIASSIDGTFRRIQFTPDLMPSDISGVSVFRQDTANFEFHPGPIFANIVLADEINRASPRTQSALLEVMAERTLTYDGQTYPLPSPFMVLATQNPIEMDGTFALPEAQLDRFLMRIDMGYPGHEAELQLLENDTGSNRIDTAKSVISVQQLAQLIGAVGRVHASEAILEYVLRLIRATRSHSDVRVGCSPRCSLGLLRAAKATALLEGRDYVLPMDVANVARAVIGHRLILHSANYKQLEVVQSIVEKTPAPPERSGM